MVRTRISVDSLDPIVKSSAFTSSENKQAAAEYYLVDAEGQFFTAAEKNQIGRDAKKDSKKFATLQKNNQVASTVDTDQIDNKQQLISYPITKV